MLPYKLILKCYNIGNMIAQLTGTIINKGLNYLVVDVAGVGYKVFASATTVLETPLNAAAMFFVHSYIREDQISLYGFLSANELNLFELLISVSGVGPKVALNVMSGATASAIASAIKSGDPAVFTQVSGVGKKIGERIVIELKEKMERIGTDNSSAASRQLSESLHALTSLGYGEREAREALKKVPAEFTESGNIVRAALKILGKS